MQDSECCNSIQKGGGCVLMFMSESASLYVRVFEMSLLKILIVYLGE